MGVHDSVNQFSAACWHFAEQLTDMAEHAGEPIIPFGLISSQWGGTMVEHWVPNATLNAGACKNSRRSVSGNIITVGSAPVSWQSKRQHTVALSTCEAEYMSMGDGAKEGLCVMHFFSQFAEVQRPAPLFHDNQGAGYLASDEVNNNRSKHIDIRHHFIRSWVAAGVFALIDIPSANNISDLFTKQLKQPTFDRLRMAILSAPPE